MKFLLGKKLHMTQIFSDNGRAMPATAVLVRDNVVTQIRGQEKDGYSAVQIGTDIRRIIKKPQAGHLKDLANFRVLREFVVDSAQAAKLERGASIALTTFAKGDKVEVIGTSKGKGFQGVVKRHGFHGQDSSHGHKDQERMPGSIGAGGVQRVFKNVRMAGHMGDDRITVKGLEVVDLDLDNNIIYIKGALPGARNSLVMISGEGEVTVEQPAVEATPVEEVPAEAAPIVADEAVEVVATPEAEPATEVAAETPAETPEVVATPETPAADQPSETA